jgi:hypothetical protein
LKLNVRSIDDPRRSVELDWLFRLKNDVVQLPLLTADCTFAARRAVAHRAGLVTLRQRVAHRCTMDGSALRADGLIADGAGSCQGTEAVISAD